MKKQIVTYFLLSSYLALFTANIFHFHHINFIIKNVGVIGEVNNNNYQLSYHSAFQCPVHLNFNNLHNSILADKNNFTDNYFTTENYNLIKFSFVQPLYFYTTFSLRAPPSVLL